MGGVFTRIAEEGAYQKGNPINARVKKRLEQDKAMKHDNRQQLDYPEQSFSPRGSLFNASGAEQRDTLLGN